LQNLSATANGDSCKKKEVSEHIGGDNNFSDPHDEIDGEGED
jgi:hypothetical protein